ncbi:hypothetical protein [Dactylosporangium cerinum]
MLGVGAGPAERGERDAQLAQPRRSRVAGLDAVEHHPVDRAGPVQGLHVGDLVLRVVGGEQQQVTVGGAAGLGEGVQEAVVDAAQGVRVHRLDPVADHA